MLELFLVSSAYSALADERPAAFVDAGQRKCRSSSSSICAMLAHNFYLLTQRAADAVAGMARGVAARGLVLTRVNYQIVELEI